MHHWFNKFIKRLPIFGKWREDLIRERLWSHKRLLFVNFIFQRLLGINMDTPWSVNYTSVVSCPEHITIERGVRRSFALSIGCYFQGYNGIFIGEETLFGPGVRVLSANHEIGDVEKKAPPIYIGRRCWLGANVIILPGITLGNDTIVGAGAVVTRNFPEGKVVLTGIPAKAIRSLAEGESLGQE